MAHGLLNSVLNERSLIVKKDDSNSWKKLTSGNPLLGISAIRLQKQ